MASPPARSSPRALIVSAERLRGLLLWLMGFAGAFVFVEPSPYEIVGLIGIYLLGVSGVSLRGGSGVDLPVDSRPDGRDATLIEELAIGQTVTPHDVPLLGDFTYYISSNVRQNIGSNKTTFLSLTPGFRTHLGHNFWLLGGVEVPLTGPKPFDERFTFLLVKGF